MILHLTPDPTQFSKPRLKVTIKTIRRRIMDSWAANLVAHLDAEPEIPVAAYSVKTIAQPVPAPVPAPAPAAAVSLRVDMRESGLKAALTSSYVSCALPVADVWIGCSGEDVAAGGILLERKTVADFDASVKDGRYREQKGRLLAYAQERGAKVAYVVEGDISRSSLGPRALTKLIARCEFVYGIPVFRVRTLQETAELVETLLAMWAEGDFAATERTQKAADGIHVVKKTNNADPHTYALNVLCQCPGVSVKIAEAWLTAHGGSLKAVMEADVTTLANLKVGARRVGNAVAERFKSCLRGE